MEHRPQAGWESRQLRLWEQQLWKSGTPAPSREDEDEDEHEHEDEDEEVRLAIPPEAGSAEKNKLRTKARQRAEGVDHHQEAATRILFPQVQQENAGLLSSAPRSDAQNGPRHNSKRTERRKQHRFWDGKLWRQNLFNKYADHLSRVHESKSLEVIDHSDVAAGKSRTDFEELEDDGSHAETAISGRKESEQQYFKALRRLATSVTAEQQERSAGPQVQKKVEERNPDGKKNNFQKALRPSSDHRRKGIATFGRQDPKKFTLDSDHLLKTGGPCRVVAVIRSSKECGAAEQKLLEDATMKERLDTKSTEDLRRIDINPSQDHRSNAGRSNSGWPDFSRKQGLAGSLTFQGTEILDHGGPIISQECENSKQSEGRKPTKNKAGVPRNVPFDERGSGARMQRATPKDKHESEGTMIAECEFPKRSEGLASKGSERREANGRASSGPESKRRSEGSQELCEAQDPKGYNLSTARKGGRKDSLQRSESRSRQGDEGNKGSAEQQSWARVDWSARDNNNKRLIAAAATTTTTTPWLRHAKARNAARAFTETKLSLLQPQYRTFRRVKDCHCEAVDPGSGHNRATARRCMARQQQPEELTQIPD